MAEADGALPRDLAGLIEALYARSPARLSAGFEVCLCGLCMTPEDRAQMIATPVRLMPLRLIQEYTQSAHGLPRRTDDLRALLPRYLDLLAAGAEIDRNGIGVDLRPFGDIRAAHPDLFDAGDLALLDVIGARLLDGALAGADSPFAGRPLDLAVILLVGGWSPEGVLARLDRAVAAAEPEALLSLLRELTWHAEGGRRWFPTLADTRPRALPAMTGWARRFLTSEPVLALVTTPPPDLPAEVRLGVEMVAPDLDRLVASLDRSG